MAATVRLERLDSDLLSELGPSVHELYRRCFSEPPWNESRTQFEAYHAVFRSHLAKPGMSALAVRDGTLLVGLVYGWAAPAHLPDDAFHLALSRQVPRGSAVTSWLPPPWSPN
jgi:hypothetical protein